jgi:hypothetical protein
MLSSSSVSEPLPSLNQPTTQRTALGSIQAGGLGIKSSSSRANGNGSRGFEIFSGEELADEKENNDWIEIDGKKVRRKENEREKGWSNGIKLDKRGVEAVGAVPGAFGKLQVFRDVSF